MAESRYSLIIHLNGLGHLKYAATSLTILSL